MEGIANDQHDAGPRHICTQVLMFLLAAWKQLFHRKPREQVEVENHTMHQLRANALSLPQLIGINLGNIIGKSEQC